MTNDFAEAVNMSVHFCKKALDSDSVLMYRVDLIPIHAEKRCGYNFTLELHRGADVDCETLIDVTSETTEAEQIFNLLSTNDVFPCHLYDVITDFISA